MLHVRGDITGMFLFFLFLFLGFWQLVISWKRLNGLSLTGYPDRRGLSLALGILVAAGSCGWYFSRPGHFASPDVEGIETLILLALGLTTATALQVILSSLLFRGRAKAAWPPEMTGEIERMELAVGGQMVPALYLQAVTTGGAGAPALLLHDYGDDRNSVSAMARFLSLRGHSCLAVDLDGHGENGRGITTALMEDLLDEASRALRARSGRDEIASVGVGLGGALCMELAARDPSVLKAIAVDPPARDAEGYPAVNAARELRPPSLLRATLRPGAREGEGTISLARILESMPPPGKLPGERVTVIAADGSWFNSRREMDTFVDLCGVPGPVPLTGRHATVASRRETLEVIARELG